MIFGPPGVALGGDTALPSQRPGTSVQGFGAQNQCLSWTDGCVLCTAGAGGKAQCSTPGIACTPTAISCQRAAP